MREQRDVPEAGQVLDRLDDGNQVAAKHRLAAGEHDDERIEPADHVSEVGHLVAVGDLPVIAEVAARVATLGDLDADGERALVKSTVEELPRRSELLQRAQSDFHAKHSRRRRWQLRRRPFSTLGTEVAILSIARRAIGTRLAGDRIDHKKTSPEPLEQQGGRRRPGRMPGARGRGEAIELFARRAPLLPAGARQLALQLPESAGESLQRGARVHGRAEPLHRLGAIVEQRGQSGCERAVGRPRSANCSWRRLRGGRTSAQRRMARTWRRECRGRGRMRGDARHRFRRKPGCSDGAGRPPEQ